ncbi:MAG: class I SAM-dependent methyltransferase, partial [Pseudolabrys sp.]|nr:class I SAM-dependent methyltransferase [Pseudolabrys sp.]
MSEQAAALNPQAAHFARVHSAYVESYYDPPSMEYRRRFLTPLILRDIDLNGKTVADIGCGGGANSADLIHTFPGAVLFGFDIVSELTSLYTAETGRPAYCLDFTTPLPAEFCGRFDYVFALGVLHHMVRGLHTAMDNIHAMLKPGGIVVAV